MYSTGGPICLVQQDNNSLVQGITASYRGKKGGREGWGGGGGMLGGGGGGFYTSHIII
jgi:hypothetical protein